MAFENVLGTVPGQVAGADLSAAQFHFVKAGPTGVVLCGNGEQALGVLQGEPAQGEEATVWSVGSTSKVRVGTGVTLTVGAAVASDANGEAAIAATGEFIIGYCLSAAGAGEIATVHITMPGVAA